MSLLETAALTLVSPALLAGDSNPATNPCLDCGACCSHFRVSFYIGELAGENGGQVPLDLVTQMSPLRACMKGTEMGGGRRISLTRTEFALLQTFMENPRKVLERSWLLDEVWGFDFPATANSLEVYIGYLRRKTEQEGETRLIHTVRGIGYILRETPP